MQPRSSDAYRAVLAAMMPPGRAFPRDIDAVLSAFLGALADGMARFDAHLALVLQEWDPQQANALMPEFEADFGLPDPCAGEEPTLALRQAQLLSRMTSPPEIASQSMPAFVARAAAVGYEITITEPKLWTCMSACTDPLYTHAAGWDFAWYVNAPAHTLGEIQNFTCMDSCITPLRSWGNTLLECVINRDAPPDTTVIYAYQ